MEHSGVSVAVSERLEWLSQPKKRQETTASPSYYNVAEAYDACYKKNKPKLTFSKPRGATRLQMEEAALERAAARKRRAESLTSHMYYGVSPPSLVWFHRSP